MFQSKDINTYGFVSGVQIKSYPWAWFICLIIQIEALIINELFCYYYVRMDIQFIKELVPQKQLTSNVIILILQYKTS